MTKSLNSILGRAYYRVVSLVPLGFGIAATFGAYSGFVEGPIWFGCVAGLFGLGCFWLVRYCWSSDRQLSDLEE